MVRRLCARVQRRAGTCGTGGTAENGRRDQNIPGVALGRRPRAGQFLDYVRDGDTFLVTKLDRLARSAIDLLNIIREMQGKGVAFKALDQSLDMTTPAGKLQLQVLAAVAEFETAIRRERQMEDMARAKAEGRTGGRPKFVTDAIAGESFRSIAKSVGFSVATIHNVLKSAPARG
nr:recombinase family protein [Phyllobacterium sp. CL33Tsu]